MRRHLYRPFWVVKCISDDDDDDDDDDPRKFTASLFEAMEFMNNTML